MATGPGDHQSDAPHAGDRRGCTVQRRSQFRHQETRGWMGRGDPEAGRGTSRETWAFPAGACSQETVHAGCGPFTRGCCGGLTRLPHSPPHTTQAEPSHRVTSEDTGVTKSAPQNTGPRSAAPRLLLPNDAECTVGQTVSSGQELDLPAAPRPPAPSYWESRMTSCSSNAPKQVSTISV